MEAGAQDDGFSRFADQVDLPVAGDWGGKEYPSQSQAPHRRSRVCTRARHDADLVCHIDQPFILKDRGNLGRTGGGPPLDVAAGDIAAPTRQNRHIVAIAIAAAQVDDSVVENRRRNRSLPLAAGMP